MNPIGYARSREYWIRFGWGTLVGLLSAVGAFIYIAVVDKVLMNLVWPGQKTIDPFSGSIRIVMITTLAGLLIGIIHKVMDAEEVDLFSAIPNGDMPTNSVIGALLVSVPSLVGGFALGPEGPTGIMAGGLGVWLAKKRGLPKAMVRTNLLSGVAGAYAGLFTSPFAMILMALEFKHRQTLYYYGSMAIIAVSALLGFTVFYTAEGNRFSDLLRILDLPTYQLEQWHVFAGILLGILGVVFAFIFALSRKVFGRLLAPLEDKPIIRCTGVGLVVGLVGFAMPVTLFLGTEELLQVVDGRETLTVGFLVLAAVLKILMLTLVLTAGFVGGPIFPLLFVGGAVGVAVWQIFPAIPIMMAVGCMMAAVPCALFPFPATLAVVVLLITGTPVMNAIPVLTAGLTAQFVLKGLVLSNPATEGRPTHDIDAELQEIKDVQPDALA
jgi:H+/Cl- antiporter ClcA